MKFIVLTAITATIYSQIQLFHPDNTPIFIDKIPGCYNIFPAIDEVTDTNGLKLEFYKHSNCGGRKIKEIIGDSVFDVPVHAYSVNVSDNKRKYRYFLADWDSIDGDFANERDDFGLSEDIPQNEGSQFDTNQLIFDFEKIGIDWSQAAVEAGDDGIVRCINT
jgi:hypothetical protein